MFHANVSGIPDSRRPVLRRLKALVRGSGRRLKARPDTEAVLIQIEMRRPCGTLFLSKTPLPELPPGLMANVVARLALVYLNCRASWFMSTQCILVYLNAVHPGASQRIVSGRMSTQSIVAGRA